MGITPLNGLPVANVLDTGMVGNVPFQVPPAEFDRFQQTLEKAGFGQRITQVEAPVRLAQIDPTGRATDASTPADAANAANRAVQGLELDPATRDADGPGTAILEGLGKLRGLFDTQLNDIARQSTVTNPYDAVGMMQLQAELVQFSVVVDVTSKLAGKSTQALDSLMKGQ